VFSHDMTGRLELYVINADGTGLRQLTIADDTDKLFPRWSPNGLQIVFLRAEGVRNAISLVASDGSGEIQDLTRSPWEIYQPTFTPDGRQILFGSQEGGLVSAIWVMNLNGSNKRRLTAAAIEAGGPDVSPDGTRVAFYNHQNTPRPSQIFVMSVNGTGVKQLTPDDLAYAAFASYSPDGTKIAFQGGDSAESTDVFIMDADGSHITKIAANLVSPGTCVNACVIVDWGAEPVR
jgi:Tol biopolymer transport system component